MQWRSIGTGGQKLRYGDRKILINEDMYLLKLGYCSQSGPSPIGCDLAFLSFL